jgi:hypothetical protein
MLGKKSTMKNALGVFHRGPDFHARGVAAGLVMVADWGAAST